MTLTEFPAFRRAQASLPFLIAALALALAAALPLLPPFYIRACADTLLAALIFHGLRAARLPLAHTLAITALTFAQAGIFLSATGRAGSIWLALAVYCVAQAAAGFVQHRDARRVMVLGAALSLAQVLDPMGALLAMFLLPVCVGLPRPGEGRVDRGLAVDVGLAEDAAYVLRDRFPALLLQIQNGDLHPVARKTARRGLAEA